MRLRAFLALLVALAFALAFTPTFAFAQGPGAGENGQTPGRSETQASTEPGYLGAQLQELDAGAVKALGLAQDHAILILFPTVGGPAEKTGLIPGDVIVTLNSMPVPALAEFIRNIKKSGRGTEVTLAIWRRGQIMTHSVPLAAFPQTRPDANETLERQITGYRAITTILAKDAFPTLWANSQYNLGTAFASRLQGSRAENIEAAIKAFEAALTVYAREAFPVSWARVQHNLGNAYRDRVQGSRAENIEAAIKAFLRLRSPSGHANPCRSLICVGPVYSAASSWTAAIGTAPVWR